VGQPDYRQSGRRGRNFRAQGGARSRSHGYILLLTAPGPLIVNQSLYPQLSFDPGRYFTPNCADRIRSDRARGQSGVTAELIALAKAWQGMLNFGSSRLGLTTGPARELLMVRVGNYIVHAPSRGAASAVTI
jgi:hypothetical protein